MKKIGILGGLSPESTITYYKYITREYYRRYGDYSYPEIIIYSVNFQEFVDWQNQEKWDIAIDKMAQAMGALHKAGANFGLIATNTMHIVFDEVRDKSPIPLISIVDATVEAIKSQNFHIVGLLGTVFTMKESFYKDKLMQENIRSLVPKKDDQKFINQVIYQELARGQIKSTSKIRFLEIIERLGKQGAQGIILGCTEIPLLINQADCAIKLFDTATIHAEKALNYALN